jgi:hypothetical protein
VVLRGEITEAQREDVLLIENVVLRPIHKRDDEGQIVGVVGSEVVSREELAP